MRRYLALLTPENSDDGYVVRFPDLPGCFTQGDDFDDAVGMATEVLALCVEAETAAGRPVAAPRHPRDVLRAGDTDQYSLTGALAILVPLIDGYTHKPGISRAA